MKPHSLTSRHLSTAYRPARHQPAHLAQALVRSDTTLAQLHLMIQIFFDWAMNTCTISAFSARITVAMARYTNRQLNRCFHHGERFRYVYNYYAQWQCDIRLEATLPFDPKRFYPVCPVASGRPHPNMCKMPGPIWSCSTNIVTFRHGMPCRVLADAAQIVLMHLRTSR